MWFSRGVSERADRDIAAFLVVVGIICIISRVSAAMAETGQSSGRQWVVSVVFFTLAALDIGWLCWRLNEYERIRGR